MLLAKWNYGNPTAAKVDAPTWEAWRAFVNIVACPEVKRNFTIFIYTAWTKDNSGEDDDLIGWAIEGMGRPEKEYSTDPAQDWRIQTHPDLIPIALAVARHNDRVKRLQADIKRRIQQAIEGLA